MEEKGEDSSSDETMKDVSSSSGPSQIITPNAVISSALQTGSDPNEFMVDQLAFSSTSLTRSVHTPETHFCRICHERNLMEPNISPCDCRGTMALVHKSCLERWLAVRDSSVCELCGYTFTIKRILKYDVLKALMIWLEVEECRKDRLFIVYDTIRVLSVLPFIFLANHQTTFLLDLFEIDNVNICDFFSFFTDETPEPDDVVLLAGKAVSYFLVGAVSALDILLFGWFCVRVEQHYYQWQKWYRTQCVISLVVRENDKRK